MSSEEQETTKPLVSEDFFQGGIARGLERMRLRLLDLTNRNRLLHFRNTKRSSLQVVDEVPESVHDRLCDGADEVHRQSVARRVLRGYEPHDVPSEHVPTRREAARERFADLLEAVTSND